MNLKTVQQLRITSNCIKSLWNRSFCIELIGEQRDASHQDGRLQKGESDCIATSGGDLLILKPCTKLAPGEGVFHKIDQEETKEYQVYRRELAKDQWDKKFPYLPDN
eukprot:g3045.t1